MNLLVRILLVLGALLAGSCATQETTVHPQPETSPVAKAEPPKEVKQPNRIQEQRPRPPERAQREVLRCAEDGRRTFNRVGIEVLPFLKAVFVDLEGDGVAELVLGDRKGTLSLYARSGIGTRVQWQKREGYFNGIRVGAFASPAVGDFDGDGSLEVAVGTGGFSSDSGRILFFRNRGTVSRPRWERVEGAELKVGNDAVITAVDYDGDGKTDIVAGNSEGKVVFFRNASMNRDIAFMKDRVQLPRGSFGMYAAPAAVRSGGRTLLAVGNSMGRMFLFELKSNGKKTLSREISTSLSLKRFPSPAFVELYEKGRFDLVISDSDGVMSYYANRNGDFSSWEKREEVFQERIFAGPACTPTVCTVSGKTVLIVGNIDGTLKAFELHEGADSLMWTEKVDYLRGIKVSGFSRAMLADWRGKEILIVGQSDGSVTAFFNSGRGDVPLWKEDRRFFEGVRTRQHSSPAIFDLDGDGQWELVVGGVDGKIVAYRQEGAPSGDPRWREIGGIFENVRVSGFSTPSLERYGGGLYLFVGQEDGRIRIFRATEGRGAAGVKGGMSLLFVEAGEPADLALEGHSSPFVRERSGVLEMISGDYDGNIRLFTCRMTAVVGRN